MATRRQMADDIEHSCGSRLVSFGKLAKYLGMCPHSAREFLADVPCYNTGKKRCFLVTDVAKKLELCEQ